MSGNAPPGRTVLIRLQGLSKVWNDIDVPHEIQKTQKQHIGTPRCSQIGRGLAAWDVA